MITVSSIRKIEDAKTRVRKETYRKIYEQFCRKIQCTVSSGHKNTMLQVPPMLIGFPIYNIEAAHVYLKRQLERSGFDVTTIGTGVLYVSWNVKKQEQKETVPEPEDLMMYDDTLPSLMNLKKAANRARMR